MWMRILISLFDYCSSIYHFVKKQQTKKSYILENQIQIEIFFRLPTKAHILQVRIICWKHDIGLTSSKDMKGPKKQGERNWVKTHFFLCLHEAFFFTANFLPPCHLFGFLVYFQIKPLTWLYLKQGLTLVCLSFFAQNKYILALFLILFTNLERF